MSRRIGLLLVLGGLVLALVGILFVAFVLRQVTAPVVQATAVPSVTLPVVVTNRSLPVRALVAADDVSVVQMPVEFAPMTCGSAKPLR